MERLLINCAEDVLKPGRRHLTAEDIEGMALLLCSETKKMDLLQLWKRMVQDIFKFTRSSDVYRTDSLVSALARARILSTLLDVASTSAPTQFNMLQSFETNSDVALSAAIQYFNDIQGLFDPLKVQPFTVYTTLLDQEISSQNRVLLMKYLSTLFNSQAQSSKSGELTRFGVPLYPSIELLQLVSWDEGESMTNPETTDMELKLRGALLAYACKYNSSDNPTLKFKLNTWIRMLKLAGSGRSVRMAEILIKNT